MLSQENYDCRLQFFYSLFDISLDGIISRDEMSSTFKMFLQVMLYLNYSSYFVINKFKAEIINERRNNF